jgi:glucose/mannose-6-phosphate isomerase
LQNSILDDKDEIRKIDKSNMLAFYTRAAEHYRESAKNAQKIQLNYPTPENVIIAGMGGSAIGGELLKDYTRSSSQVPIDINRDYTLPAYAGKNSLVILGSYSGDTEETLGSFVDAINRKCMIYCISSGGNLIKYAKKLNVPYLTVKGDMPPRAALPHMLIPMIKCLEKTNIIPTNSNELSEATKLLEKMGHENDLSQPLSENFAKNLATNLDDCTPVIYGFGIYRGVALRFKQQFNENAKVPAKWETFSELNHNETMGWENPKALAKCYAVIFLRDKFEPLEVHTRIETTMVLMQHSGPKTFEVWAQGKSTLAKMLSTILIGDITSVYLAMLRNVDPTPVSTVTLMKDKIEQNGVKNKILNELEKISAN